MEDKIMFSDKLIPEYVEWKSVNKETFNWWSFVNMKADLQTALGFAKFFYPDIIEFDGCFLLKDKFSLSLYKDWKEDCNGKKEDIEKMMNLYEVKDFFHINTKDDGNFEAEINALGDVLKLFWSMSFKKRYPNRNIEVYVFMEDELFITVYEKQKNK